MWNTSYLKMPRLFFDRSLEMHTRFKVTTGDAEFGILQRKCENYGRSSEYIVLAALAMRTGFEVR